MIFIHKTNWIFQVILKPMLRYTSSYLFIFFIVSGYVEGDDDGSYRFVDGSESDYTNWAEDQPNDENANNCVMMNAQNNYAWDDVDCDKASLCYKNHRHHERIMLQ